MNWELFGIGLYVLGMIGMGTYFARRIKTEEDYFLGGRSLGPGLATFSIFATWFGAETCIGTAGTVYSEGIGSIHADPLGYTICLLVMFGSILLHLLICYILKIDRDTALITSMAGIFGPAFVPPMCQVLKNRAVLVSGITSGLVGYALGNFAGLIVAWLLKA